ncbi:hypothetical protein ACKUSY_07160 [Myroides odoratus]
MITKRGTVIAIGVLLLLSCKKTDSKTSSINPLSPERITAIDTIFNPNKSIEMREFIEKETNKRLEVIIPMDAFEDIGQTLVSLERQDLFLGKDVNENGEVWNNEIEDYVPMDEDPIELNETDLKCSRELYHLALEQQGLKPLSRETYIKQINKYFGFNVLDKENHLFPYALINKNYAIVGDTALESTEQGYINYLHITRNPIFIFDIEYQYFDLEALPFFGYLLALYSEKGYLDYTNRTIRFELAKKNLERCKFILHDDAKSLSWLLHFDYPFCAKLIGTFGYLEKDFLNAFVLNKQASMVDLEKDPESIVRISALIKHINASDGTVVIHEKLMQYIYEHTTQEDNTLLKYLDLSATVLINEKEKETQLLRNGYSRADRIKVFAYAAYYSFITHDKFGYGKGERNNPSNWFATCSLYLNVALDDGELIAEIKRNNYYNHEGIKKAFTDALAFYEKKQG